MNNKGSILIIGINFFPEPTGIGKYTGEFAFAVAEKGIPVDVITSFPYYPQWKIYDGYKPGCYRKEKIQGVNVTRCPCYVPSQLSGFKRMLQDFTFFVTAFGSLLGKMIARKKYQLIFVASPSFMSGFLGIFFKLFNRKTKFVYHVQDLQVDAAEELGMIRNPLLLKTLKSAEGLILKQADCVSTISKGMQARITAKPFKTKQLYLFPNWVDFGNIYKKEPDISLLEPLGFPLDKKLVFYSGAVGEKQGLEIIIEVASFAKEQEPDFFFLIAGSGPYAITLKEKAAAANLHNLRFIDLQPIDVFNELLNHAFLHLVIQKEQASDLLLPSKLTNILAVGGLAIVTASPGTTLYEIVASNNLGIVVPPDNRSSFCEALKNIGQSPGKVAQLKENAANYANQYLDKNHIIDNFLIETGISKRSKINAVMV